MGSVYKFVDNKLVHQANNNASYDIKFVKKYFGVYYYKHPSNCKLSSIDYAINFKHFTKDEITKVFKLCTVNNFLINIPTSNAEKIYNHFKSLGFVIKQVGKIPIGYNNGFQELFIISLDSRYKSRIKNYKDFTKKNLEKIKSYKSDYWRNKYIDKLYELFED